MGSYKVWEAIELTPDMDALRGITQQINVFVRFFESINYLFCQIRWLEQNIQNSSRTLILIVGALGFIAYLVYFTAANPGANYDVLFGEICRFGTAYFPIIAVVMLIGFLLVRRFSGTAEGELGSGHGFENVFFGQPRRPPAVGRHSESGHGFENVYGGQPYRPPAVGRHSDIENPLLPKGH